MRTNIGKEGKKIPYSSQNTRVALQIKNRSAIKEYPLAERCRRSRSVAKGCLHLSARKTTTSNTNRKGETAVSQRLINFVL